jgi:hypothetical protein
MFNGSDREIPIRLFVSLWQFWMHPDFFFELDASGIPDDCM